jgi:hypothetical protein
VERGRGAARQATVLDLPHGAGVVALIDMVLADTISFFPD